MKNENFILNDILKEFPKVRNELPPKYEEIYLKHYRINRNGESFVSYFSKKAESWLHKKVASDLKSSKAQHKIKTLEIGAGTLNQLEYELPLRGPYDIVEPFIDLFHGSENEKLIRNKFMCISEIPLTEKYDRITSIATLEHLTSLPEIVARSGLILAESGKFRASIPSEGSILWGLSWRLTTGIDFKLRYGLDYAILRKYEHVNTAWQIEVVLRFFFKNVKINYFGFSRSLSIYQYLECSDPLMENCEKYLEFISYRK